MIKVIGAGMGRTGTLSLKAALELLGFGPCYHMVELLTHPEQVVYWEQASQGKAVDWPALFANYQATVDFPGYFFYKELMQQYPAAKVILTVRDPNTWYESTYSTIYQAGPGLGQKLLMTLQLPFSPRLRRIIRVFRLAEQLVWQQEFKGRFADKTFAVQHYRQHIDHVRQVVPPERLLVYDVKQGWAPLCRFLQALIPEHQPFPHLNQRSDFQQLTQQLFRGG